jgi:hypothetical protein
MILCESCDKCFHTYCLKTMDSMNSTGWKCTFCKREYSQKSCTYCGNINLKEGELACDECYETTAKKSVSTFESNSDIISYFSKLFLLLLQKRSVKDLLQMSSRSSSLNTVIDKNESSEENSQMTGRLPANKPTVSTKKKQISKKNSRNVKRTNSSSSSNMNGQMSCRSTRSSRSSNGKDLKSSCNSNSDFSSSKRSLNEISEENESQKNKENDEPTIGHIKRDEEDHHAVTVISSLNDSFTLKQDMCLNCGSFGHPEEDPIISCSQCGQCYHNYCAGINNVCFLDFKVISLFLKPKTSRITGKYSSLTGSFFQPLLSTSIISFSVQISPNSKFL